MSAEREHVPDWEHLSFAALLLAFIVWYLLTAAAASLTFSNLILIAPVGAVAAALLVYIASAEIFGRKPAVSASSAQNASAAHGRFRSGSIVAIAALMGLFGAFVVAIPYIGFDIATFLFVGATLRLLGERNVAVLLSLALGIAVVLSIAALTLLTFPMPMAIARAVWSSL